MSVTLSYVLAKDLLTEVEKERIVCTYLNSTEPNAVDWEKAAADYGAASVESYKKGMQNTTKKIKKAMDSGVQPEAAAEGTPAKANNRCRKRKEKAFSAAVESESEEAVVEEAPKKKKAKAAPKKTKAALKAEAEAAAAAELEEGEIVEDGVQAEFDVEE